MRAIKMSPQNHTELADGITHNQFPNEKELKVSIHLLSFTQADCVISFLYSAM